MQVRSDSFPDHGAIPGEFAFCVAAAKGHVALAPNRNPHLAWSGAPAGTRSFALICHDPDAPASAEGVNQEGERVAVDRPRADFFHWLLVDLPPQLRAIEAGAHSEGVQARGKAAGVAPGGQGVQGLNDYSAWFTGDADMEGQYGGYDGPCPPWNDERVHRYHFTIYALDLDRLGLSAGFGGRELHSAIAGHVLAQASWVGTYTLNPSLR